MDSAFVARVAALLTLGVAVGACFDFDATIAGGPLSDGGALDAGGDSTTTSTDGAAAGDASTHDGASADGGADSASGPFCASYPRPTSEGAIFFCDDFDDDTLPGNWASFETMGGTMTETDASFVSPPNSLDESFAAIATGTTLDVALRTPFSVPPIPTTLTFAFSVDAVRIDTSANAAIVLGALDFLDSGGARYSLVESILIEGGVATLSLSEQSGLADGGMPYIGHALGKSLTANTFSNISLVVDWTATTSAEAKVSVDGAQVLDTPLTMTVQAATLQLGIGTSYVAEPSPGWELRYDDVVFTAM